MKLTLTTLKNQKLGFHDFSSPPSRSEESSAAEPTVAADSLSLSEQALEKAPKTWSGRRIALTTLTAVSALTALAGPVAAQTPPGTGALIQQSVSETEPCCQKPVTAHDLRTETPTVVSDSTKTKFGVEFSFVNDNMPNALTNVLGGPEHKTPDGDYFDDDGWTAELRLETNFQKGDTEYVVGGRLMMATETGSYDPTNTDFTGKRTDVGELLVQRNERRELSEQTTLDFGVGGGLQGVGNLGGESVQRWWHEDGLFGGRTGTNLQGDQVNDSFRVLPVFTAGGKLTQELTPNLNFQIGGQAIVPIGRGLGNVGLKTGVEGQWGPVSLELGGKLDGTWSNAPELDFMDVDGVRPGLYTRLEVEAKNLGRIYTQVETGGFRNEPILSVGIRIGGGSGSRLSPFQ